ncbi:MAG: hypothetical protein Q8873_00560 [Bacillota bacterium]|nr:hypothetical protein [Bacillota bacterium]
MNFTIESTYNGRALIEDDGIVGAATLTPGQAVALTAGAGKPTATLVTTAVADAIVTKGNTTGEACKFVRIFRGDVLKCTPMAADGTTALSSAEKTSLVALVGAQAMRVAATGACLDGVTTSGGKMELLSYNSTENIARTTIKA